MQRMSPQEAQGESTSETVCPPGAASVMRQFGQAIAPSIGDAPVPVRLRLTKRLAVRWQAALQ